MTGQARLLQPWLEQQRRRIRGDLKRPRQEQQRRHGRDDGQIAPHGGPGREQGEDGDHGHGPDQRHERGGERDGQPGGPGRPACPPGRPGQHPPGQQGDHWHQDEDHRCPDPARGDRAHGHGQQRIRGGGPDAEGHGTRHPPHREERGDTRKRHAAEQDHVHGEPRLAAEQGGKRGDQGQVRRRAAAGADSHRVKALQVLAPQASCAAPGGDESAAAQRGRAEQRALGDQRHHGQAEEQQHPGAGQNALHQPGVGQQEVGLFGIVGRVMRPRRVDLSGLGHRRRGELRDLPQRLAGGQVLTQPPVGRPPASRPGSPYRQQPVGMAEHGADGGQLVECGGQPLGDQEEQHPQDRDGHVVRRRGEHRPRREVPGQGQHGVAPVKLLGTPGHRYRPPPPGGRFYVVHDGVGDHPDPVARRVHPPAEVGIFPEERHAGVEAADRVPDVAADQHARAAHGQAVAISVVLALVHLARLDAGDPAAYGVDGNPGLEDHPPVGPVLDLGTEHRGRPGLSCPAEQLLQGVRRGLGVVVQQPHPLHSLSARQAGRAGNVPVRRAVLQRAGDRRAVARAPVHAEHDRLAEQAREHRAAAIPAAGINGDHALHRPGLLQQRLDDLRQPCGTVMRDDHRRDDVLRVSIVR